MESPRNEPDVQACIDAEVIRHLAAFEEDNQTFLIHHLLAAVRRAEAGDRRRDSAAARVALDLIA